MTKQEIIKLADSVEELIDNQVDNFEADIIKVLDLLYSRHNQRELKFKEGE